MNHGIEKQLLSTVHSFYWKVAYNERYLATTMSQIYRLNLRYTTNKTFKFFESVFSSETLDY